MYFLAILSLGLTGSKLSCGGNQAASNPPNGRTVFEFEYDYMTGYNVFASGETYARNPFSSCNTDLTIAYDQENITPPSTMINFTLVLNYMQTHAQKYLGGSQHDYIYTAHLLGMNNASNKPFEQSFAMFATTFRFRHTDTSALFLFTAIYKDEILSFGGDVQAMLQKTVIHELGHSRGNLTHLCDPSGLGWVQAPEHDDPSCVMGTGHISLCSSNNLTINPHFCPADCERLKKITW